MKPIYTPGDLVSLLTGTPYEAIAGTARPVTLKGHTYQDLFRIGSDESGYYAVKLRPADKRHVNESIRCLDSISDPEHLIATYSTVLVKDDTTILVSEWVEGSQPFQDSRGTLPEFFRRLAAFNQHNPSNGPFTSMYADGHYFKTLTGLVNAEIDYHLGFFDVQEYRSIVVEAMQPLKRGLACITFEDTNPGNMFVTIDGRYVLIDTEWLHPGLNLHQFDHMNYLRFREPKWYDITDEAEACYSAYFSELGIGANEANAQIRAFELLAVLRANTYWHFFGMERMCRETPRRIGRVLAHEEFVHD